MDNWLPSYQAKGYHFPLRAFNEAQALQYRKTLEEIESSYQGDQNLKLAIGQANSLLPFVDEITRSQAVLNPGQGNSRSKHTGVEFKLLYQGTKYKRLH